jgi:hypothetical protein
MRSVELPRLALFALPIVGAVPASKSCCATTVATPSSQQGKPGAPTRSSLAGRAANVAQGSP